MYELFYGFREKPFSLLPDPDFLYLGKKHRTALTMLQYGLTNQSGFTVIAGEIGCGKTTLIRHLLNNIEQDVTVGLISNTQRAFGELLQWVLLAFDLEYRNKDKVELYQSLVDFIIQEYAANRRTVLIIDEAQNMDAQTLEEVRMISNVNADKDQVIQIILVGQPQLRATLKRPDLTQFAQRIAVSYFLEHLDAMETKEYIYHRIRVAGGDETVFNQDACGLVYKHTKGIPRLINIVCDTAFVYGFAEQKKTVDISIVREVIKDKNNNMQLNESSGTELCSLEAADADVPRNYTRLPRAPDLSKETARELFSGLRRKTRN